MLKETLIQLSKNTIHIGSLVSLNEKRIIKNQRGKFLDIYRAIEPKIVSHIQISYMKRLERLNIVYLVGNYWFGINELNINEKG